MMFDDEIYNAAEKLKFGGLPDFVPLAKAAKSLKLSTDDLLQRAAQGDIEINIIFNNSFYSSKTIKFKEQETNQITLPSGLTVPAIRPYYALIEVEESVEKEKTCIFCGTKYKFVCNSSYFGLVGLSIKDEKKCDPIETDVYDDCTYRHFISNETITIKRNLFISLETLLSLSVNQLLINQTVDENKPTLEQLQAENEALKLQLIEANARIAELEAKQSSCSTEPTATSKATINAFFKGLNASYGKTLDVPRIVKAAEELGEKISGKTIYKYLDKGV